MRRVGNDCCINAGAALARVPTTLPRRGIPVGMRVPCHAFALSDIPASVWAAVRGFSAAACQFACMCVSVCVLYPVGSCGGIFRI